MFEWDQVQAKNMRNSHRDAALAINCGSAKKTPNNLMNRRGNTTKAVATARRQLTSAIAAIDDDLVNSGEN